MKYCNNTLRNNLEFRIPMRHPTNIINKKVWMQALLLLDFHLATTSGAVINW